MKRELMIDLETLGTGNNAAVAAIGAVFFDKDGLHRSFYRAIDLNDAGKYGTIDGGTVKWWLQQEHDARAELYLATAPLVVVLQDFADFINNEAAGVWGFGATFDNVILRSAYTATKVACPWHFRIDRCFRTLAAMNPNVLWEPRVGVHHNALDDAVTQAKTAIKMLYPTINIQL
jgi:exodeoxyribonuclease VIII